MVWIYRILFNIRVDDFQSFAVNSLVQSKFMIVQVYLQDKFLKVEMPGQRVLFWFELAEMISEVCWWLAWVEWLRMAS